jgi:hypothetical protein
VPFISIQENIPKPDCANEVDCIVDVPLQETLAGFEPDIEHYHTLEKQFFGTNLHIKGLSSGERRLEYQTAVRLFVYLTISRLLANSTVLRFKVLS